MDQWQTVRTRSLFVPKTEQLEQDEVLILRVHLPGFSEKDIDCRIIAPSHYVRVCSGPALKNWHFDTLFEDIPERFDLYQAKSQFLDGILTIEVPKIIPQHTSSGPMASEATKTSQEARNSEDGNANQTSISNGDKELAEVMDFEARKDTAESMIEKGHHEIPSKAADWSKHLIDDQKTVGEVGDQETIQKEKERSSESVDQVKEQEAKDTERIVVTERRVIFDNCTILSLILAIGAYVVYHIYGQSRKKN